MSVQKQLIFGYIFFFMIIAIGGLIISDFYVLRGITPFEEIDNLIEGSANNHILIVMILIQILATTALLGAGYPGGIFAPSLFIGALTGLFFSTIFNFTDPDEIAAWAIIGMSGAHAATTKTPVASVLLILEITGLPNLIIPILLVNISSYIVSGHRSLYRGQLRSRDATIFRHLKAYDQHEGYTVGDVMTRLEDTTYFTKETSFTESMKIWKDSKKRDFPVVHSVDDMTVIGMVFEEELLKIEEEGLDYIADDFMETKIPNLSINLTGRDALTIMLDADRERLPVIDSDKKLIGIISIGDIVRGHQTLMEIQKITRQ